MGLDMYLTADTYVKNWDFMSDDEKTQVNVTGAKAAAIDLSKVSQITEEIGYWRKANAVHAWFVRECQGGVDECQRTYVPAAKLVKLRQACQAVLADHSLASELLPTTSGFFFGSTAYDEYYFQDLEDTIKILDAVVEGKDYFYESSW